MPRPRIDLDAHKEQILTLWNQNQTAAHIATVLDAEHNFTVTDRTIRNRLRQWGVEYKRIKTQDSPELRARILVLFFEACLRDEDILYALNHEGHSIGLQGLVRIRKELGIKRKLVTNDRQEADAELLEIVRKEFDNGSVEGYGKGLLYTYFRHRKYIVARDRLFTAVKIIDPEGVARRARDMQRHRGEYIVPGPNYVWSIDGYCKLELFGIQIYAGIDAYSRYIVWIYVGITNRTKVSVLRQYLDLLEEIQIQPQILRSDHGVETPLMAEAHWQLRLEDSPDTSFTDTYWFGTSTMNQRGEAWWGQMTKSQLYQWRDYFHRLRVERLYNHQSIADRIAILHIYMPIIRAEVFNFVTLWNSHKIRKQKNRPNIVVGQPIKLYNWPGDHVENFAVKPNMERLRELKEDYKLWDPDEYLPQVTIDWCDHTLMQVNIDSKSLSAADVFPTGDRAHPTAYLRLREAIRRHMTANDRPELLESVKPRTFNDGRGWQASEAVAREWARDQEGRDVHGEGPDPEAVEADFEPNFSAED